MNSTDRLVGASRSSSLPATPTIPATTNPPARIIGIAGLARSGKDTVADFLQDMLPGSWERYSFATPLKDMLMIGLGLHDKDPRAEELYDCNYRKLAQTLGTEWGRDTICENIWVRIAAQRLQGKSVIISDIRMENEAEFVRKTGGVVVHLERTGQKRIEESEHKTEAGISIHHNDYKILNGADLDTLELTCRMVAEDLQEMLDHKLAWGLEEDQLGLDLPVTEKCRDCNGDGEYCLAGHSAHPRNWRNCESCNGTGEVTKPEPALDDITGWNLEAYRAKHGKIGDCATQCNRRCPAMTDPTCGKCQQMAMEGL